jgi:type IV fimbrial biogenesis protein FimT
VLFAVNISSYHKKRQQGLTLVEVLIALAIMAILFGVLAPNIHTILSKNRITAAINAMSSVVQYGRFSAIDQNGVAVVCPSHNFSTCSDNWNLPKIVFIDANTNNQRDNNEPLLMTAEASSSQESFTGPDVPITFDESGATNMSVSIVLCSVDNPIELARAVNINQQGRTRISTDSNADDIHEDIDGNNLVCS